MAYSSEVQQRAQVLRLEGLSTAEIVKTIQQDTGQEVSTDTIERWVGRVPTREGLLLKAHTRLEQLIGIERPTPLQLEEIDLYWRMIFGKKGAGEAGAEGKKAKKAKRNDFSGVDLRNLPRPKNLYWHQLLFLNDHSRRRFYLKPRKVGMTFVLALSILERIIREGVDQIVISASKLQGSVINSFLKKLSLELYGVQLVGSEKITVNLSGARLACFYFVSPSSIYAQAFDGDLSIDEFCHIPHLDSLLSTAKANAVLVGRRTTYISTPSSTAHPSYAIWKKDGQHARDNMNRVSFNIEECIKQGYDLISMEDLQQEYFGDEYDNLFMLKWLDASNSYIPLKLLEQCQTDESIVYRGGHCWLGWDVARSNDDSCVVIVEPDFRANKFRVVKKVRWRNMPLDSQEWQFRQLCKQYRVHFVEIDGSNGLGVAVYDRVKTMAGVTVKKHLYSAESKMLMLANTKNIIQSQMLEYETEDKALTAALLAIKVSPTASGRATTFYIDRAHTGGHFDEASALLHALNAFDFTKKTTRKTRSSAIATSD